MNKIKERKRRRRKGKLYGRDERDLQSSRGSDAFRQFEVASLAQDPGPQLDAHDAEDEKHEEAQEEDVAQHWEGVQEQHDQNPHAFQQDEFVTFDLFLFFVSSWKGHS